MISYDLHMHSNNSLDGRQSVDDACRAAIQKGLKGIAITDHVDVWFFDRENTVERLKSCYEEVKAAREKYDGKLKIYMGVEMAEYLYDPERSEKAQSAVDYDVILGSVHSVKYYGIDDSYSRIDFSTMAEENVIGFLNEYFDKMLEMIRGTDFDILTHLTCPVRYINGKYKRNIDISIFDDKIRRILSEVIERGLTLEVNTSGFDGDSPYIMPDDRILRMYYGMGGRMLSIGSDAHVSENIAKGFDRLLPLLLEIGFDSYVIYEKRRAVILPLKEEV